MCVRWERTVADSGGHPIISLSWHLRPHPPPHLPPSHPNPLACVECTARRVAAYTVTPSPDPRNGIPSSGAAAKHWGNEKNARRSQSCRLAHVHMEVAPHAHRTGPVSQPVHPPMHPPPASPTGPAHTRMKTDAPWQSRRIAWCRRKRRCKSPRGKYSTLRWNTLVRQPPKRNPTRARRNGTCQGNGWR